jgi:hypothetical protein
MGGRHLVEGGVSGGGSTASLLVDPAQLVRASAASLFGERARERRAGGSGERGGGERKEGDGGRGEETTDPASLSREGPLSRRVDKAELLGWLQRTYASRETFQSASVFAEFWLREGQVLLRRLSAAEDATTPLRFRAVLALVALVELAPALRVPALSIAAEEVGSLLFRDFDTRFFGRRRREEAAVSGSVADPYDAIAAGAWMLGKRPARAAGGDALAPSIAAAGAGRLTGHTKDGLWLFEAAAASAAAGGVVGGGGGGGGGAPVVPPWAALRPGARFRGWGDMVREGVF